MIAEELTSQYDDLGMKCERDAFDTLFDHAPDKLQVVKKSLITFANKHLNKINLEVIDLDNQFADGVFLVLLVGLLESYFVPLYEFHITPQVFDEKVNNVALGMVSHNNPIHNIFCHKCYNKKFHHFDIF